MPVNNATANTQIDFLSGLMLPVGLFFTCGIIAIVGYFYTRVFWRSVLDLSRGGRFLFYSTSMFIVPAAITGLVDVIDLADLKSGTITKSQSALLSILAVLLVIYLYMHGCWFDRNEAQLNAQQKDVGAKSELTCQRDYLLRLLIGFRTCICHYADRLSDVFNNLRNPADGIQSISPMGQVKHVVEAVRTAYEGMDSVPEGVRVCAALMREDDNGEYLEVVINHDGLRWNEHCAEYSRLKEYFRLSQPDASVAVASVCKNIIITVPDAQKAHEDPQHPFKFFSNEQCQRAAIGSMIAIPFNTPRIESKEVSPQRWVCCFSCPNRDAFKLDHLWKAKQVQSDLAARIGLLQSQSAFIKSVVDIIDVKEREMQKKDSEIGSLKEKAHKSDVQTNTLTGELDTLLSERMHLDNELAELRRKEVDRELKLQSLQAEIDGLKKSNRKRGGKTDDGTA